MCELTHTKFCQAPYCANLTYSVTPIHSEGYRAALREHPFPQCVYRKRSNWLRHSLVINADQALIKTRINMCDLFP